MNCRKLLAADKKAKAKAKAKKNIDEVAIVGRDRDKTRSGFCSCCHSKRSCLNEE